MTDDRTARQAIERLEAEGDRLQEEGRFTETARALEEAGILIGDLGTRLEAIRTRGYPFKKSLEQDLESLELRWPSVKGHVQADIDRESGLLRVDSRHLEDTLRALALQKDRPLSQVRSSVFRAQDEIERIRTKVDRSAEAIRRPLDVFVQEARSLENELAECERILSAFDQASFHLDTDESPVLATGATWLCTDPNARIPGTLYLTDKRILFERFERQVVRRFLILPSKGDWVREIVWEAPISSLSPAEDSETRRVMVLKREKLLLRFRAEAHISDATLQIDADSRGWGYMIERVLNGAINTERVGQVAEALEEEISAVQPRSPENPGNCPNCGAPLPKYSITPDMVTVTCAFCHTVVRLKRSD